MPNYIGAMACHTKRSYLQSNPDVLCACLAAEWEEWGNPQQQQYYEYMKSYSPVDNVKAQE
jgi:protease II